MIAIKLMIFYLLLGAFVNLYVFFAEQAALKQMLRKQMEQQDWDKAGLTGWKMIEINFDFDFMAFIFGTLLWPVVVWLVLTKR